MASLEVLEQRLATLEAEVAQLKAGFGQRTDVESPAHA